MGTIKKMVDQEKNITVFSVVGDVTGEEYEQAICDFYEIGPTTKYVLWDLTEALLEHVKSSEVFGLQIPRSAASKREGGKTAIVAPSDLAYGLARMYESGAADGELPFSTSIFRTPEEAMQWLTKKR